MKRIFNVIFSLIVTGVFAQEFDVETLMNNGPTDKRINFVYMGDGYTVTQQDLFLTHAQDAVDTQFNFTPYKQYVNFFNAFGIKVISNESGTDHPQTSSDPDCTGVPIMEADTYFNSTFDAWGIHRLIIPGAQEDWPFPAVTEVLVTNTPFYDQGCVLVNTPYYGGSGGAFATVSVDVNAGFMMIHEIGHSFAGLADEYWAGEYYAAEKPNMTQENNPLQVKWKNWIGDQEVGIYPYGATPPQSEWFRPHQNCMMRALSNPFCAVCTETIIDRIYTLVSPIDTFTPDTPSINYNEEMDLDFSVDLVYPIPNTLEVQWLLDGEVYANDITNLVLPASEITSNHVLTVIIEDTTPLSRTYTFPSGYLFSVSWNINHTIGITESSSNKFLFRIFPNPSQETLNFEYTAENYKEQISVHVFDQQGKEVLQKLFKPLVGKNTLAIDLTQLSSGIYILEVNSNLFNKSYTFIKE